MSATHDLYDSSSSNFYVFYDPYCSVLVDIVVVDLKPYDQLFTFPIGRKTIKQTKRTTIRFESFHRSQDSKQVKAVQWCCPPVWLFSHRWFTEAEVVDPVRWATAGKEAGETRGTTLKAEAGLKSKRRKGNCRVTPSGKGGWLFLSQQLWWDNKS